MLRDVKVMKSVFPSHIRKSKANTLNMKKFLGSILFMKGGTSSGNYRRMTLQTFTRNLTSLWRSPARAPAAETFPAFARGWFEVQDLGSQIAATCAGEIKGLQVFD